MIRFEKYFDLLFRIFFVFLPFYTVLSVFFSQKLGIPGVSFLKEILLFLLLLFIAFFHLSGKRRIEWSIYDILIGAYILSMCLVTVFTTGLPGLLYGGRYDFSFFIAFLVAYHGSVFLDKPISYYVRLFLISGGGMIFLSMLLKWPFSEDALLYLGYSGNPSNWVYGGAPPIFHGVEGANVRRFQGLLDGPNTMAGYILMYIGVLVYYFRFSVRWHFVLGVIVLGLSGLVLYTYSRSALLGLFLGVGLVILFLLPKIFKKYKAQFLSTLLVVIIVFGGVAFQYAGNLQAIISRGGSTQGHAERMTIGIKRFLEKPLGQGMASAGPAYRSLYKIQEKNRQEQEDLDKKYIPESWYIQQLVEGGVTGFSAFVLILLSFMRGLFRRHVFLLGMFVSLCTMNMFLHTFESAVVSLSLFTLIGLFLSPNFFKHESKKY